MLYRGPVAVKGSGEDSGDGMSTDAAPPRAVTIRDVAARAGVSIATASRGLDERLPPSRGAKSLRVREVAEELGYRRDPGASSLRRGTTGTIGVVVPRLTDMVMAMLYEEIADASERQGRFAIVVTTRDEPPRQRAAAEGLLARRVDGLILASARANDDDYIAELRARGVNHVLALRTSGDSPAAVGDDYLGGYLAGRHLTDLGHTDIGLIAGPEFASSVQGRMAGFHAALAEAGVPIRPDIEFTGSFGMEAGEEACRRMLERPGRPAAMFLMNDNSAIGALSALTQAGLRVPDDVSVVGYNDIPVASRFPVPLTAVRVPFRDIARNAVDLLTGSVGADQRVLKSAPTLIPRASTARRHPSPGAGR